MKVNLPRSGPPCKISPRGASMISPKLHGRTWSMTWTELGPQSQRKPLVTWIKILQRTKGPPAQDSACPGLSEVCRWPSGWSRGGMGKGCVIRWDQNRAFWSKPLTVFGGWVQPQEHHPSCEEWRWKHHCLGMLFCIGDRMTAPYWGEDGWGYVSWDLGQQPPSLSKSIEDGSSSRQWPATHSQGN